MTITELRYITTLAQEQHFGRAAALCHVSQPTLSIAVKKLEDELGLVLFERGKLYVMPTTLGQQIINKAQNILHQTVAIKDIANTGKEQLNSPFAIGTLATIGPYLMPQFIPLLQELAANMPLFVDEADAATLTQKLYRGELDALIISLPFNEPDVLTQPLFDEAFVALIPEKHPLAAKPFLHGHDLHANDVLLPGEGLCIRQKILQYFPHLAPAKVVKGAQQRQFQSNTLEALRHMVASGLGISILPKSAAENTSYGSNLITIRPFANPEPTRTLAIAWRASFPRYKAIDTLSKALRACSASYWNFYSQRAQTQEGLLVNNGDW